MTTNENKDQSAAQTNTSPMAANEASANKPSADNKGNTAPAKDQSQSKDDAEAQAKKAKEAGKNAA